MSKLAVMMTKDDIDIVLGALEEMIDRISEEGNPNEWARGAKVYRWKVSLADMFRRFDVLAAKQAEEDEG